MKKECVKRREEVNRTTEPQFQVFDRYKIAENGGIPNIRSFKVVILAINTCIHINIHAK